MDIRRRGLLFEGNKSDESSGSGGNNAPGHRPVFPIIDYETYYFTLHMLNEGNMTLYVPSSYTSGSLAYSVNDGEWITFSSNATLTLVTDDEVKVKCITGAYTRGSSSTMFSGTCNYEVYGNAMSLLYGDDFEEQSVLTTRYSFQALFYKQTNLKNAENLILPATTLTTCCYYSMFYGCTSLTSAPELPATTLAESCCNSMFCGCTSLTEAPQLLAITLATNCYGSMFGGCTSLTEAPQLLAITLKKACYSNMFRDCSELNKITMLATTLASNCLYNWVNGVASSGTFVKNAAMTSLPNGTSGIPTGWTVQDYNS